MRVSNNQPTEQSQKKGAAESRRERPEEGEARDRPLRPQSTSLRRERPEDEIERRRSRSQMLRELNRARRRK